MPTLKSAAEILPSAGPFVREYLESTNASDAAKKYRFEHCLRVARIGREVAEAEGMDADLLELGCLLHDVGKFDAEQPVDHGRAGALVAVDFLREAGLPAIQVSELAQGIAMHTDGQWNPRDDEEGTSQNAAGRAYVTFDRQPSLVARSIGECDNVDRFSAYRIYDTMQYVGFLEMSSEEQAAWIASYRENLVRVADLPCSTKTVQRMFTDAVDFQETYFDRLAADVARAL